MASESSEEFQRALAARDAAMERVDANAPEEWKRVFDAAIVEVARRQPTLTCENPRDLCREAEVPEPHDSRAIGPRMKRAQSAGAIRPTSTFTRYTRKSRHTADVRVWESLIYQGEEGERS
jgi:hypothetical protein